MVRKLLIALIISVLFPGIGLSQEEEQRFLFEDGCELPCWSNLIPGQSTDADVLQQLPEIASYSQAKQTRYHTYPSVRFDKDTRTTIRWWYDSVKYVNRIDIDDSMLTSIVIYPQISFDLEDVLVAYGDPSSYSIISLFDYSFDRLSISLSLYYPEMGLIVVFDVYDDVGKATIIEVSSDVEGKYFSLHQPHTSSPEFVREISRHPSRDERTQDQLDRLRDWDDSVKIETIAVGSTYITLIADS